MVGNARPDSVLAKKLTTFFRLSPAELNGLPELQVQTTTVKRGRQLIHEGQTGHKVFVLQAGWACSYKTFPVAAVRSSRFRLRETASACAVSCCEPRTIHSKPSRILWSVSVDGSRMLETFSEFPRLGTAILWAASRDEAMVVEHLVSVGRRSAIERTAHFFMELAERLNLVGMATEAEFACPLSQYVLADALGLSAIHVNRVLRQLRERELLAVRGGKVIIHDLNGLRTLAGFQGGYLNARD